MSQLNNSQIRFLRSRAHSLNPVVMVAGNGLSETVMDAIDEALEYHELIKVKLRTEEREEKLTFIEQICKKTRSTKIQTIGHIVVLYRPAKNPKLIFEH
ncbi:MAG: ribosome assembly RNA-binding protein YhbY [Gammaproteobacteria bacterium CG22_combo_CG10-13_8_21_14_all_40_8]|nr:MAG: ribosome assembly RNA-binding protein YhbY [Gammaproteobacteria bacterium CG22_combo_CG10-13_8_21_14_all_40_8]